MKLLLKTQIEPKPIELLFDTIMDTEEVKDVFIPTGSFDKSRLRILDPVCNSFKKGDSVIEWTTSEGRYIDDDGKECELYFELPEQFCFGVNAVYDLMTTKEDKVIDNAKGLQICYPLTGMKSIESPSKDEKYAISVLQALWQVTWDKMKEECEKDSLLVPEPTYNSYLAAQKRKEPERAVKPVFSFPMKEDDSKKKIEDKSKPRRAYIKLLTKGDGRKMRCSTQIYGPGDKQDKTGLKYLDVRGRVHMVVKWEGAFWGSHGQKAPYGASVRLRVAQMNFTPQPDEAEKRRMLPQNSAPVAEDDGSDNEKHHDEDSDGENEGFVKPGEDDGNPLDALGDDEVQKPNKKKITKETKKPAVLSDDDSEDSHSGVSAKKRTSAPPNKDTKASERRKAALAAKRRKAPSKKSGE